MSCRILIIGGVVVQKTIFLALYTLLLGAVYVWAGTPKQAPQIPLDQSFAFVPNGMTLKLNEQSGVLQNAPNASVDRTPSRTIVVANADTKIKPPAVRPGRDRSNHAAYENVSAWEPVVVRNEGATQNKTPIRSAGRAAVLRFTTEERLFFLRPEHKFRDMSYLGRPPEKKSAEPKREVAKKVAPKQLPAVTRHSQKRVKAVTERRLVVVEAKDKPKTEIHDFHARRQRVAAVELPPKYPEAERLVVAVPSPKPLALEERMTRNRIARIYSERRDRARIAALIRQRAVEKKRAARVRSRRQARQRVAALTTAKLDTVSAPKPVHRAKKRPAIKKKKRAAISKKRAAPKRAKRTKSKKRRVAKKRVRKTRRRTARLSRRRSGVSPGALHRRMIMGAF